MPLRHIVAVIFLPETGRKRVCPGFIVFDVQPYSRTAKTAAVPFHREGFDLLLQLPDPPPDSSQSVIELRFAGPPQIETP